ncbi:non-ribosomal peptide synthetase [Saccharothrix coeruleofusca]|uniref:Carrier domain-containing protein n=1 Tax=Saccharothrix coeruleofusca TaxID=33919 RepID=A0A918EEW1_9PSEU|nr:non-ribosomal peptide synthetase [Saccharothrix coeruleofusca]GGP55858.1 hypothetical protein GCM10010185_30530 [Saccharothrix coeruleofusca]
MSQSGGAPLSPNQRALWFLDRLIPGTATYNVPWLLDMKGPVDEEVLRQSLNAIVDRHEVLRTVYGVSAAGPCQTVLETAAVDLVVTADAATIAQDASRPFDLERETPIRARLVRSGQEAWQLLVVLHHIAFDELSLPVFEKELAELYEAALVGRPPELPLPVQYRVVVERWRTQASDGAERRALRYWRERLAGAPERLVLPADRPRPPVWRGTGTRFAFDLPREVCDQVRLLAKQEGVTPFIVMLSAFTALLHRYTGMEDLVIGSPLDGRESAGVDEESAIGHFVSMLPVRTAVSGHERFADLIARVLTGFLDDLEHRRAPFAKIVEALGPRQWADHQPLVQVVFGFHGEQNRLLRIGPATGRTAVLPTGTAKFDLTWSVFDDGVGFRAEVEYCTDLFDAATIERMAAHWRILLAAAVHHPETTVADLPVLTDDDWLVVRPHQPVSSKPTACPHMLFEAEAAAHPASTAVTDGVTNTTYADLNARANQLARLLVARGVRPGDHVGLVMDPSVRQVIAVLAVLKTGAAYVPVEVSSPEERVDFVLSDAAARLVVTDAAVPERGRSVVHLDADAAAIDTQPVDDLGLAVSPSATAYVIYTSGSTGRPKGVAVAHANVMELFASTSDRFGFDRGDVWTLFHSFAFDFAVWEFWGALLHGGRLVVVPRQVRRNPAAFADLLRQERVTVLSQTPTAFDQLVRALRGSPRRLELRLVVLGGEALTAEPVRRWFSLGAAPSARLCNMYGITETTVHVTAHDITADSGFDRSVIGRPLPHLSVAVLDRHGRHVPVGVPGEIHVGGGGTAIGYIGRPELTARRFVPDPNVPGARVYRSGDLARWLPDGDLEYLGRADDQVKIRGFRVEPGEVRQALTDLPGVLAAVVVAGEDGRLLAYAVPGPDCPTASDLRQRLALRLPDYMVPAVVTFVDDLPRTSNGKVDLRALPPAIARGDAPFEAPEGDAETALAEALGHVLSVARVGRHDDFFGLGGDSVRGVQVVGRLQEMGYDLALDALFACPTVTAGARRMTPRTRPSAAGASAQELLLPADRERLPDDVEDAYPMTAMQLAMVYHMEVEPALRPYHNVNSYRIRCGLDARALERALAEAIACHPVLRTCFDLVSFSEPMQLVHRSVPLPLTVRDLSNASPAEREAAVVALVEAEWATPFAPDQAPLLRVTAQRLGDDAFQLTLTEHHAILDGWSFTSLLAQLLDRHAAFSARPDLPPAQPSGPVFRRFVAMERSAVRAADSLDFWADRLTGVDGVMLAGTIPPDGGTSARGLMRTVDREVDGDICRDMVRLARSAGTSAKSVFLAAHFAALHQVTGRRQVVTGVTVNGRPEEAAGTTALGLFVNIVPLVASFENTTWRALIGQAHDAETAVMPHRRVPFASLIRLLARGEVDVNFTYNRFHALDGPVRKSWIEDDRIGSAPTLRYEPNSFPLSVGFVQDPASDRALLVVSHAARVPHALAVGYTDAYLAAARAMTSGPEHIITSR